MNLLQRLLGLSSAPKKAEATTQSVPTVSNPSQAPLKTVTARYYETMSAMQGAMSRRDYAAAADAVRANLSLIPGWAQAQHADYGSFMISSIPTIEQGGTVLALVGDEAALQEMVRVVSQIPDLESWTERVRQSVQDVHTIRKIMETVAGDPGCLQSDLKARIGGESGTRAALLAAYLEKAGRLARIKSGRSFKLYPPGALEVPSPAPKREVGSHRSDRKPPSLREIDISQLEYVPLPRAPPKWEEEQAGRQREEVAPATAPFEVRDADWTIDSVEKLRPADRPDAAFRLAEVGGGGLFLIDDVGRAEEWGTVAAAALRYDRKGQIAVKSPLLHDVYRVGVHPLGRGLIALSRTGTLHVYDDDLKPIVETALSLAPEIVAIRNRFTIGDDELKNHIRCVALTRDAERYLFTAVDEAWCVTREGVGLWGAKLPLKDGWARVATPSSKTGTSAEVQAALNVMGLSLPITPDDLKSRYRTLAKQWHPDLNRSDPKAGEKMIALNAATEVLTGVEGSSLPEYTGARFMQELHRSTVTKGNLSLTFTMGLVVGEKFASDWIYAASFAANSNGAYLAGYSGRIVQLDQNGVGIRVYDIGAVPRQIIDTGSHLYLLTHTRLYVLRDNALYALVDTFDGGDLVVTPNGFGLIEKKRLRWYGPDGSYRGSVVARDPIRRLFWIDGHMAIETRQMRAHIRGSESWWAGEQAAAQ